MMLIFLHCYFKTKHFLGSLLVCKKCMLYLYTGKWRWFLKWNQKALVHKFFYKQCLPLNKRIICFYLYFSKLISKTMTKQKVHNIFEETLPTVSSDHFLIKKNPRFLKAFRAVQFTLFFVKDYESSNLYNNLWLIMSGYIFDQRLEFSLIYKQLSIGREGLIFSKTGENLTLVEGLDIF